MCLASHQEVKNKVPTAGTNASKSHIKKCNQCKDGEMLKLIGCDLISFCCLTAALAPFVDMERDF